MEEAILKEILHEMKGFREDNKILKSEIEQLRSDTNQRFEELRGDTNKQLIELRTDTNQRFEELRGDTNKQFIELRSDTNQRFDELKSEFKELNEHQKGLKTSVEVLQYAINETRYELIKIKEYLANRVIWNNDSINIVAEDGNIIYGTIKKNEKKVE